MLYRLMVFAFVFVALNFALALGYYLALKKVNNSLNRTLKDLYIPDPHTPKGKR